MENGVKKWSEKRRKTVCRKPSIEIYDKRARNDREGVLPSCRNPPGQQSAGVGQCWKNLRRLRQTPLSQSLTVLNRPNAVEPFCIVTGFFTGFLTFTPATKPASERSNLLHPAIPARPIDQKRGQDSCRHDLKNVPTIDPVLFHCHCPKAVR